MNPHTFTQAVAAYFRAHPHEDISNWTLMEIGGKQAYRSRVSNCRRLLKMNIPSARVVRDDRNVATSFYRYCPPVVPSQQELEL